MALKSENEILVGKLITAKNASFRLEERMLQRQDFTKPTTIIDYKIEVIDSQIKCNESLEVVQSLSEFVRSIIYVLCLPEVD